MTNLDLDCAVAAQGFIDEEKKRATRRQAVEKLVTDTGAVLAENGPYAMFLHLAAREGKDAIAREMSKLLYRRLKETLGLDPPALGSMATLSADFHKLLLARRVLQQTLAYLRHHAKALPKERA